MTTITVTLTDTEVNDLVEGLTREVDHHLSLTKQFDDTHDVAADRVANLRNRIASLVESAQKEAS